MKRLFDEHKIRNVIDLNGTWSFKLDPDNVGEAQGWQNGFDGQTVIVPSVWNNELRLLNYEGCGWYMRRFDTQGGTLLLEFESVMTLATVWLDGVKMPVIDSLGDEFLEYVKTGNTITVKENGVVEVE